MQFAHKKIIKKFNFVWWIINKNSSAYVGIKYIQIHIYTKLYMYICVCVYMIYQEHILMQHRPYIDTYIYIHKTDGFTNWFMVVNSNSIEHAQTIWPDT